MSLLPFAGKLIVLAAAAGVAWSALGLLVLLWLTWRRVTLPDWQVNLVGGPLFLWLALRGALLDRGLPERLIDLLTAGAGLALAAVVFAAFLPA